MSEASMKRSATFSQMMAELNSLIESLALNEADLDEMVKTVERGYSLIKSMQERLDKSRMKIESLKPEFQVTGNSQE